MMEEAADMLMLPMSSVQMRLIDYTLFAYTVMVQDLLRQSPQQHPRLLTITSLRQRIAANFMLTSTEQLLLLTEDELMVVLHALTAFIRYILALIPPSHRRDDIITVYADLRAYLLTMFPSPNIPYDEKQQEKEE
jgi:hypothetical protein